MRQDLPSPALLIWCAQAPAEEMSPEYSSLLPYLRDKNISHLGCGMPSFPSAKTEKSTLTLEVISWRWQSCRQPECPKDTHVEESHLPTQNTCPMTWMKIKLLSCVTHHVFLGVCFAIAGIKKEKVLVAQLCSIHWHSMDCSPPGSSVHGTLQARILERVAIPFCSGSYQSREWTRVSCIGRQILY